MFCLSGAKRSKGLKPDVVIPTVFAKETDIINDYGKLWTNAEFAPIKDFNDPTLEPVVVELDPLDIQNVESVEENVSDTMNNYVRLIEKQKKEIEELSRKNSALEQAQKLLKRFLTDDQIYRVLHPNSRSHWSDLTIQKCLDLYYHCGTRGYELLIANGYPLPLPRTLQRHIRFYGCEPGILYQNMDVMKKTVAKMCAKERKCVLMIDEMQIQAKVEYDPGTGAMIGKPTVPPSEDLIKRRLAKGKLEKNFMATKLLNGMVAGYFGRFANLVWYEFTDSSFNKRIVALKVLTVITYLQYIGLEVMSFATDMGNLGL